MTNDGETHTGMGHTCCGPWLGHNHARLRLKIGVLLLLIGSAWYGVRAEWFEITCFHAIPIGPVAAIMIGFCMIYRGWKRRKSFKSKSDQAV